ncbi:hypothetical protein G7B40_011370 [Aetokthonos hydrillicola Thurmond2011]|jgi:branched-chain amino acid transport system permease protein|uniref:N,N-dimethylformamidase alpha subunit domain-containing protein n=1 Tax=Aetokthonos hydrillicola Thurmond2011 TaxID=2712845 RepID=A0AAP5I521_9CYAN|nr:hypothetical protein [Aetokthonos hydrillicola]MBO3460021.1 hypothetical protein [Aetokthonos hydrillicola CCALA 1050]MBW4584618.1 hypothetical protein [Aetokthonos hydrillicola CCALA 1050]MDR9895162.1 hypothetical protein [Aetokthonos hydrillicola Thurmond2011]
MNHDIFKDSVKHLVNQNVLEEHASNPIGNHSDALKRILVYLRKYKLELRGKYIIVCVQPYKKWCIGKLSGVRGVPPQIYEEECFGSEAEAEHGIFIKRIKELGFM